jgi:hypothetical protein
VFPTPSVEEIAQATVDEAKRNPKVRAEVEDVRMYDDLTEHAGWRHLRKRFEERQGLFLKSIAKRLLRGEEVSQSEIDFQRGYYTAVEDILDAPEKAVEKLELRGRMAWVAFQLKVNEAEGEEAPYA